MKSPHFLATVLLAAPASGPPPSSPPPTEEGMVFAQDLETVRAATQALLARKLAGLIVCHGKAVGFKASPEPLDSIVVPSDLHRWGTAGLAFCDQLSPLCATLVWSADRGEATGVWVVGATCFDSQQDGLAQGWTPELQIPRPPIRPFSNSLESDRYDFPVLNPVNLNDFLERNADKTVVVMYTIKSCGPCQEVKEAVQSWNRSDVAFALVDLDDLRYFEDGKGSAVGEALAQRLGLERQPTAVPVLVARKPGEAFHAIPKGKSRVADLKAFLGR